MRKPATLRAVLARFVPALAADPTKLSLFIDKGRVASRPGSLSFEYRYTLNLVVQDFAGDADQLMVPILAWIAEHQPDLLLRADQEPFTFESELIDAETADVSITLELDEAVLVIPRPGGGFDADRVAQVADLDSFGIGCVPLWQLFLNDQLAAQTSDPRFLPAP